MKRPESTVERQLRAMEPALTEENIAGKMQLLEDAVKQLDIEYGDVASISQTASADTKDGGHENA